MKKIKRTAKNGITNPKKDKKGWKDAFQEREKGKKMEGERSFFNGNAFLTFPISANFRQRTSLLRCECDRSARQTD